MMVSSNVVDLGRGVIMGRGVISSSAWAEHGTGGRWPGDTDGKFTRSYLLIPYRFIEGVFDTPHPAEIVKFAMDRMSNEYMNGCIQFVDDTTAQGKLKVKVT